MVVSLLFYEELLVSGPWLRKPPRTELVSHLPLLTSEHSMWHGCGCETHRQFGLRGLLQRDLGIQEEYTGQPQRNSIVGFPSAPGGAELNLA